ELEGRIIHYLAAAQAHINARKYEEAIDDCRCAISLNPSGMSINPNASIAWRSLGNALLDAGRLKDAKHALQRSLALGATTATCIYLACVCIRERSFFDAERYCRHALTLSPNFDEAYFNLGSSLWGQDRTDEAIQAYKTACRLSPDYQVAHREAGAL